MASIIGRITVNSKDILEVDGVPSAGGGTAAPIGSIAMYDSGIAGFAYIKTGAGDTAWSQIDVPEGVDWELDGNALTGGSPTTTNEFLGSDNDFDVPFRRNNIELMRLASQGLLVGLTASVGGKLQTEVGTLGDENFKQSAPNGGSGAKVSHVTRQYKVQTTDATVTLLATVAIPAETRVQIVAKVMGNQHGGAGGALGDGADYIRTISAKRLAAGGAILNDRQTDFTEEDVGGFNVTIAAVGNNIEVSVTGAATRNIAWFGHFEIMIAQN